MERLELLLTKSKMFDYFRQNGNLHKELQKAVYGVVINSLMKDLKPSQKRILKHKHWHQPDPNYPETGRSISLLERLIDSACFRGKNHNMIRTRLYVYDLKTMVGLKEERVFKKQIEDINAIWRYYAEISYDEDKHISFEIPLL